MPNPRPTSRVLAALNCRTEPVPREGTRKIRFVGSTEGVARDGGILTRDGWDLANYSQNPVFLYAHDHAGLPVGRTERVEATERGLEFDVEFADRETYPFADTVFRLYRAGFLRGVSVGFRTTEQRKPSPEEGPAGRSGN